MKMGKACPPLVYPLTTTHTHTQRHTLAHTLRLRMTTIEILLSVLCGPMHFQLSHFVCFRILVVIANCFLFSSVTVLPIPPFPLFPRQPITPQTSSNDLSLASFVSPSTLYSLYRIALRNWLNPVDTIV